ncbi:methylated-DNA--[protein]-cysteine S-methyltransferase [Miltoncostaea oceani]|uniref:methylated-DNA--[protein]-cysteine S-methyltransferase n=1 Tax=Miltoncostaea oceani TaxID=2843216 RepID=UPI001C3E7080|nr:methylated-DNA--[protein]-cysteine S-methyltransferase [Miltoncostaea oceani]
MADERERERERERDTELERALGEVAPGPPPSLLDELARRADREGLVDVAYAVHDTPLGPVMVAATGEGLVMLSYVAEGLEPRLERLAREVSPRVLELPSRLDRERRELDEYFAGRRRRFDVPIDWRLIRGFTRAVLERTAAIPFGGHSTYGAIAAEAGSPRGSRATGNALGSNPIPIVIPCHRVLRSGGAIGGYTGGVERKRFLLDLEGHPTG